MMDRRMTAFSGRVALEGLRGIVAAEAFVAEEPGAVAVPLADLCASPGGARDRQVSFGAALVVVERRDGAVFVQMGRDEYAKRMGQLDTALAHSPYLAGSSFTLADIPAGFVVHRWFSMTGVERREMPALTAYYARLSERPAYLRHIRNGLP